MSAVMNLLISEISVSTRHRAVDAEAVRRIAASVEAIGLQHPVTVRNDGRSYCLIAGRHRLEALRSLGKDRIPANVVKMDDDEARMWEISENLHRAELTALERAEQIAEYAELAKKKRKDQGAQVAHPDKRYEERGDSAAARDLGLTRREVQRSDKIAGLTAEAKEAAREVGIDNNQSKLLEAAKAVPEQQAEIVRRFAASKPPKLAADPLTDTLAAEKQVARLMDAWNAAGPDARQEFLLRIDQPIMDQRFG